MEEQGQGNRNTHSHYKGDSWEKRCRGLCAAVLTSCWVDEATLRALSVGGDP